MKRLEKLYLDSYNLEKNINEAIRKNEWDEFQLKCAKDNLEYIRTEIKELRENKIKQNTNI